MRTYDVIVLGVGSMGASACYYLASGGQKVLGLEQFSVVHEEGSHTGQSRLIRKAYFEHPSYIPLLDGAYGGWTQIQKESNTQLYWPTGIAYMGEPNDEIIKGVKEAAKQFNIPLESRKFSHFKVPDNYECLFEPEAGFLSPERSIKAMTNLAKEHGAEILENQQVLGWSTESGEIVVRTAGQEFKAKKLIITAGAFVSDVVKMNVPLKVTRQYLAWAETDNHQLGNFPCWMISEKEYPGCLYGFPAGTGLEGPDGMKLGYHRPGDVWSEDMSDGIEKEKTLLNGVLKNYFVDDLEVGEFKTCKYTYSPDENFIVDFLPDTNNQVIVATGFSGHGFKFAPVIGEILADLTKDSQTRYDIDFLSLKRFT